ncbi:MAG: bifunctional UDP-N-acetylmuramoyl-tripeptide:D-alanyl-D-alanine ligase/alanine racemase [Bacteroidota bacterium]
MAYPIEHIQKIIEGRFLQQSGPSSPIEHLVIDSRQILFARQSLFIALQGPRRNGHDFISSAYEKGIRHFIVSQDIKTESYPNTNFLQVDHPLKALQSLASHHRSSFSLDCIGITGSNGKTIIKEWLFQLLQQDYAIVRSPKSYNSQIGVPLSIWQIKSRHDLGIFEAGISQVGEMKHLAPIIQCQVGIFTNIGPAHSEGFSSEKEKIEEKLQLFRYAHTLIYCADHQAIHQSVQEVFEGQVLNWSRDKGKAAIWISEISSQGRYTQIQARYQNQKSRIQIPFSDQAAIENAIHCWVLLLYKGYPAPLIRQRMKQLEAIAMRLEVKAGLRNCTLVNDSYNNDLNALTIALLFLQQQFQHHNKCLVLSDILQSRQEQEALYQQVGQLLQQSAIKRFIGIGTKIKAIEPYLGSKVKARFFPDTSSFLEQIDQFQFANECILLKGARHFAFEQIVNRLALKAHRTVLEINLDALRHNLNTYSQFLKANTRMMLMVKAAAYGSGSEEVARLLEAQQVDYLAVAYTDEGIALRKAGIELPIMVLNPEEKAFDAMIRYGLEPEIYSLRLLKALLPYLPSAHSLGIHLKLDTGMHRLGFEPAHIPELIEWLSQSPQLEIRSIFSHLAASEAEEHDAFTAQQVARFKEMYANISQALGYQAPRHILNSSGIIRFPQYQMDMVRLGIGLYGIDSSGTIQEQLQWVHTFKAHISQIKMVAAGESIGYGRAGRAERAMRIGTIQLGYADGLRRAAGNGRFSLKIRGRAVQTVGNICMDMCMIDLSEMPEVEEGDEVVVFDSAEQLLALARCYKSIPYEIFTGIADRVKRVYYQE